MFDVIIASHGSLAKSILETAQLLVGGKKRVKTFGMYLGDNIDDFREAVTAAIEESLRETDVLVLTDIQSGSPFNVTVSAMANRKFKHITGFNLPLLIEVLSSCELMDLDEAYNEFIEIGKKGVLDVNALLKGVGE
jgi:PTS system mannose-specific IIA component